VAVGGHGWVELEGGETERECYGGVGELGEGGAQAEEGEVGPVVGVRWCEMGTGVGFAELSGLFFWWTVVLCWAGLVFLGKRDGTWKASAKHGE